MNPAQLQLLQGIDYSTSFCITATCKGIHPATGALQNYELVYYITVTPEKEAEYTGGHNALIEYLRTNTRLQTAIIDKNKLRAGKLFFTVTKEGAIANARIDGTSGYPAIDETVVALILNTTGEWVPAQNAKGEKIDQELVLSFGTQGC